MLAAFEKLSKILKLEKSHGYRNQSVIGGLENFAEIWQKEARAEIRLPDGTTLVEGSGMYIRIPDQVVEQAKTELGFWEVVPD